MTYYEEKINDLSVFDKTTLLTVLTREGAKRFALPVGLRARLESSSQEDDFQIVLCAANMLRKGEL